MSTGEKAAWSELGWCEDTWPRRDFRNPRLPPSGKAVGTPHTRLGQFWVEAARQEGYFPQSYIKDAIDALGVRYFGWSPPPVPPIDAPPVLLSLLLDKIGLNAVVELSPNELDEALGARVRSGITFGEAVTWNCHVLVGDRRFAPFDPRGWENMPAEQKRQAEWLGYTEQTWSAPYLYHSHTTLTWEQLDVDARRHWTVLGWTRSMWDVSDEQNRPAACNKDWADLTPRERASAQALGYAARSWDLDEPETKSNNEDTNVGAGGAVGGIVGSALVFIIYFYLFRKETSGPGEDQAGASRMWRVTRNARQDWKEQCEARGFRFHSAPALTTTGNKRDPYWNESAAYVLTDELQGEIESTQILKSKSIVIL